MSLGDNINRLSGDKKIGCQVTRDLSGDNMEKAFVGCQVTTKMSSQGCQVTRDLSGDNMESEFAGCHLTTDMCCHLTTTVGQTLIVR